MGRSAAKVGCCAAASTKMANVNNQGFLKRQYGSGLDMGMVQDSTVCAVGQEQAHNG